MRSASGWPSARGRPNVTALVIRGLVRAVAGIAVGFGLALLSAHLVEPLLFDTSPRDPRVYALVAVTLAAMALLAAALPAARARRINPIEAMREE
jgi:putative ABC transport system permease protein